MEGFGKMLRAKFRNKVDPSPGGCGTFSKNKESITKMEVDDDDDIDFDMQPEVKFCLDEVPVPDPAYVSRTVEENLRSLIVQNCKKDCRTWLWKSRDQREVALRYQAQNEINCNTATTSTSNSSVPDSYQRQPSPSSDEGQSSKLMKVARILRLPISKR